MLLPQPDPVDIFTQYNSMKLRGAGGVGFLSTLRDLGPGLLYLNLITLAGNIGSGLAKYLKMGCTLSLPLSKK